jgi:dynein intermediate chain 2
MEYKSDAGATRFLVGTEQGLSLQIDRKAKKDSDSSKSIKSIYGLGPGGGGHLGPVYSIQRNPFNLKYFLTVGDWSAKLWMEDLRSPIISTPFDSAYLTAAQWSPTRPGVFFTSKRDGTIDVWDMYAKQNEPTFTQKISDLPLSSLKIHGGGRQVAVGDSGGTVTIVQLSKGLSELQREEKGVVSALFERETKREKNLEIRGVQRKRDIKEKEKREREQERRRAESGLNGVSGEGEMGADEREAIKHAEEEFYTLIDLNAGNKGGGKGEQEEKTMDEQHEQGEEEGGEED